MEGFLNRQKREVCFKVKDLSLEEKDRLVGAFVWLIEEDKKQNPTDYQLNNSKKND